MTFLARASIINRKNYILSYTHLINLYSDVVSVREDRNDFFDFTEYNK